MLRALDILGQGTHVNVAVDLPFIAHLLSAPSLIIYHTHFLPRSSLTRGQEQDADPNQQIGGVSIEGHSC